MRYLSTDTAKKISKIGLGTWQFGSREWNYGERYAREQSRAIVRRALELGVTLFDTAEIYGIDAYSWTCRALVRGIAASGVTKVSGFGRSESILGAALGPDRESAVLATKLYPALPIAPDVAERAAASARRLGSARIDLYQVHQPGRLLRTSATMGAVRRLLSDGVVAEVGISNGSLAAWHAAEHALGSRVLSNQVSYSLVSRSAEQALLPFAVSRGRVIIAYSPLAQGLLSGKYDSRSRPADPARAGSALFRPGNLDRAGPLIAALRDIARAHAATPAQIALAWTIHHPAVAAIPGASSVSQLESNAAAADIELTADEYRALQVASDHFQPAPESASLAGRFRGRVSAWLAS